MFMQMYVSMYVSNLCTYMQGFFQGVGTFATLGKLLSPRKYDIP